MKLSIVVNPQGEIAAASIPSRDPSPTPTAGPYAVDQLILPSGHSVHELDVPAELAKALLDGKFSEFFQHYTLGEGTLRRK